MHEPIAAYPLSWPAGWPRTHAHDRRPARFVKSERRVSGAGTYYQHKSEITIPVALDRLQSELTRLGADWDRVIVSTNVETRRDGLPRADRVNPGDPGVAIYWTDPGTGAQQCMAIDLYDSVAGNLAAVAATIDAMRAIERHGGAQILKRAFQGFKALPSSTTPALSTDAAARAVAWRMNGATSSEIVDQRADMIVSDATWARDAIRRAAAATHPDRGGNVEDFQLMQEAKRVLEAHHGGFP